MLLAPMITLILVGACASKADTSTSSPTKVRDDDPSSNCADYFANNQAHFNRCKQAQKAPTKQRCTALLKAIKSLTNKQIKAICDKSAPPKPPPPQPKTPQADVSPYAGEEDEDTEPPNELAEYTPLQQVIIRSSRIHHSKNDCVMELMAMDKAHDSQLLKKLGMSSDYGKAVTALYKLCETKYPVTCSNIVKNKGLSKSKATAKIKECEAALDIDYTRGQEDTLFKRFEHLSVRDDKAQPNIRHDRCRAKLTGDSLKRYQIRTGPSTPYVHTPPLNLYDIAEVDENAEVGFTCSGDNPAQNLNEKRLLIAYLILGDLNQAADIRFQENNHRAAMAQANTRDPIACALLGDNLGKTYENDHVPETPLGTLDFNQWEARKLCNTIDKTKGQGLCTQDIRLHCYNGAKNESLLKSGEERWPAPPDPDAEAPLFQLR